MNFSIFIAWLMCGGLVVILGSRFIPFITFGLFPFDFCSLVLFRIYVLGILVLGSCLIIKYTLYIIEKILSKLGIKVDLDIERKLWEKKQLKKERAKINKRVALHDNIAKELEVIIKEHQLVNDVSLIEKFVPSNNSYYMGNEEKYEYVMKQEQKVKEIFDKYKHLFIVNNEVFYIKDRYNKEEYSFIDSKYGRINHPYKEEDIYFLKKFHPIDSELLYLMVNRRIDCYNIIKDSLSQATMEAVTTKKGYDGEKKVADFLNLYKDNYITLNNIRVELDGQSSESDFIIICDKGVFAIEVKNHGNASSTIEISRDGRWSTIKNGRRELKDNVSAQNNRHCAINQTIYNKYLKDKGYEGEYIKCNSIIVIANDKVEIRNESMNPVLRTSEIITYIENLQVENKLSKELQEDIKNSLLANNLPPKKYPVIDLETNIKEALVEYERLSTNLKGYSEIRETYRQYIK